MAPVINEAVQPFHPAEYIQTAGTGNRVSRQAVILGSQNIVLGGKCVIHHGAVIRGDLKRRDLLPAAASAPTAAGQGQPAQQRGGGSSGASSVSVSCGRYCVLGERSVVRPAYKTYKGLFSYYTVRMGDHVHVGADSIVESAVIGSHIDIGRGCVLGKLSVLKDCIRILDGAVIPQGAVLASGTVWAGSPAQCIAELPESFLEQHELRTKDYYVRFKPAS